MSWKKSAFLVAAVLVPAACGDDGFTGPNVQDITGEYVVSAEKGQFVFSTDTKSWDLAAEGSVVTLKVFMNGTTAGRIFIPAATETAEPYEANLAGRWFMQGTSIFFAQDEQNLIGNMEFQRVGNELRADRQFIDGHVKMTLVK